MRQLLLPFEPTLFQPKLGDFIPGKNVELLHQLVLAFNENESGAVFYIWGEEGIGKTHLIEALAYATIALGKMPALLKPSGFLPEHVHVLLLDALESFQSDEQASLLSLLDDVIANGTLVVATGRLPLKSTLFRPDFASRFARGLVYPLLPPDEEALEAMLWRRAKALALELPPHVARYLALRLPKKPRLVVSFLEHLALQALAEKKPITLSLAKTLLENSKLFLS